MNSGAALEILEDLLLKLGWIDSFAGGIDLELHNGSLLT